MRNTGQRTILAAEGRVAPQTILTIKQIKTKSYDRQLNANSDDRNKKRLITYCEAKNYNVYSEYAVVYR